MHAKICTLDCLPNPLAVSALRRWDAEMVGSYPTRGVDVRVCAVFVLSCVRQRGLRGLQCKVSYEMYTNEMHTRGKRESLGPHWHAVPYNRRRGVGVGGGERFCFLAVRN